MFFENSYSKTFEILKEIKINTEKIPVKKITLSKAVDLQPTTLPTLKTGFFS